MVWDAAPEATDCIRVCMLKTPKSYVMQNFECVFEKFSNQVSVYMEWGWGGCNPLNDTIMLFYLIKYWNNNLNMRNGVIIVCFLARYHFGFPDNYGSEGGHLTLPWTCLWLKPIVRYIIVILLYLSEGFHICNLCCTCTLCMVLMKSYGNVQWNCYYN